MKEGAVLLVDEELGERGADLGSGRPCGGVRIPAPREQLAEARGPRVRSAAIEAARQRRPLPAARDEEARVLGGRRRRGFEEESEEAEERGEIGCL